MLGEGEQERVRQSFIGYQALLKDNDWFKIVGVQNNDYFKFIHRFGRWEVKRRRDYLLYYPVSRCDLRNRLRKPFADDFVWWKKTAPIRLLQEGYCWRCLAMKDIGFDYYGNKERGSNGRFISPDV